MSEVEGRITRRTANAYGIAPDVEDRSRSLHVPDFVLPALLAFPGLALPRLGVPASEVAAALLCGVALLRSAPRGRAPLPGWLVATAVAVPLWLAAVSLHEGLEPTRRLLHLALWAVLLLMVAVGRVHVLSAARGLAVGLVLSVLASLAGLGPQGYAGRLNGTIGDPNLAGYVLTVLGCVAVGVLPRGRLRALLVVGLVVAVVLTLSRTTLLATALAGLWLLVGRRVSRAVGALLIVGYVLAVAAVPREATVFGPFSDRTGSDLLRERLIAQERIEVAQAPWTGAGAGTARVPLQGETFFYHSSYLAAQREGGLILLALLAVLGVVTLLRLTALPLPERNGWLEAAILCLAVVALNLGEVLLDLPAAVAIGAGAWWLTRPRSSTGPPADPPQDRSRASRQRRATRSQS